MATKVKIDTSDFKKKFSKAQSQILDKVSKDLESAADEVLRRSQQEVPFDVGTLSDSGKVKRISRFSVEVTYNTPYAARMHEGNFNFQHGRKRKYLEDPVRDFWPKFVRFMTQKLSELLK